jgi:hypothetical protein
VFTVNNEAQPVLIPEINNNAPKGRGELRDQPRTTGSRRTTCSQTTSSHRLQPNDQQPPPHDQQPQNDRHNA